MPYMYHSPIYPTSKLHTILLATILCTFMALTTPTCFSSHGSQLTAARHYQLYKVRGMFVSPFMQMRREMVHLVATKALLQLSPDMAVLYGSFIHLTLTHLK